MMNEIQKSIRNSINVCALTDKINDKVLINLNNTKNIHGLHFARFKTNFREIGIEKITAISI